MSHLVSQQHTQETPAYVPTRKREAQVMAEQKAAQRAPRLLDALKQYVGDAAPGGALNREWTPENVRTAAEVGSMEPGVVGSALSAGLAVDDVRKGNYGDAALNAVGVLPFVPALGGVVVKLSPDNFLSLAKKFDPVWGGMPKRESIEYAKKVILTARI